MEHEDGYLSLGQKIQISVSSLAVLTLILLYIGSILVNGINYTHTIITQNPVVILFFALIPLAIGPVYYKAQKITEKAVRQLTWAGLVFVGISIPTWIYFHFHPPETGWERLTQSLSNLLISISAFQWIAALLIDQKFREQKE